eukprot:scaffold123743_cov46-Prasinocladus_malaysianus.AAC.4
MSCSDRRSKRESCVVSGISNNGSTPPQKDDEPQGPGCSYYVTGAMGPFPEEMRQPAWCVPCKKMRPIFSEFSRKNEYKMIAFAECDVDKLQ